MADRTNPAIRNIYFNSGASARHAGAFYKPVAAEDRTSVPASVLPLAPPLRSLTGATPRRSTVRHPYGIGSGGDAQITGPIVDGFRIHQQMEATMAAERAGKGLQDTSTMTVPTTGALPDGPLPSDWVPGGFPTRKV